MNEKRRIDGGYEDSLSKSESVRVCTNPAVEETNKKQYKGKARHGCTEQK